MGQKAKGPLQILVVEDHPIVRLGVRQMLAAEPDLSIGWEAETAEAALQIMQSSKVDLAIVDLSLEAMNGLELIRQLHDTVPELPVLVLSMHDEALFAERVVRAGARGYIMKQEAIAGLVRAIRHVLAGQVFVSERVSQQILEGIGRGGPEAGGRLASLTDRELEVLEMIGRGLSTADIAARLGLSVKTIETYRSNIKTKLNLTDATQLVRYATSWVERL